MLIKEKDITSYQLLSKKCHYIKIYHNLFKKGLKFDTNIQKKVTSYDSKE